MDLDPSQVKNVTALLIGRVGDLIVSTAFLRSLRHGFPQARIRLVTSARCRETAALIPFIDEVELIERLPGLLANLGTAAKLLTQPCGLLVDLNPSFSRTSSALAALVRSPVKLGFRKGRLDWIFTRQAAPAGEREHMLDRYSRLAQALGAPYEPRMELRLNPQDEEKAEDLINEIDPKPKGLRVVFHPGNFKKFENRWPEEKFVELTHKLLQDPSLRLYYMAGPGEESQVRAIISRLKRPLPLFLPAPLGVTGALMKRMDLCVLNITGTTHLAAALEVPTFGFYSGYTHAIWRPRGPRHWGVVSASWESCRDIPVEEASAALKAALSSLTVNPQSNTIGP